jgi:predicted DNA-binding protein (UPF0251 family)
MPRPRRTRRIFFRPDITYFKPAGVRLSRLQETEITFPELEAIRLIDLEEMEQGKAAKKMKISQPTLSRLLKSARKKIAQAVVNGQAIRIQGGVFTMAGRGLGFRRGAGRMGGFAAGPGGNCICTNPKCRHKEPHQVGIPCYQRKCPECGSPMIRER